MSNFREIDLFFAESERGDRFILIALILIGLDQQEFEELNLKSSKGQTFKIQGPRVKKSKDNTLL